MTTYDPKTTALLLIDPYNDFLSEGGKLWPRAKPIAEEVGLLDNLRTIMRTAREAGLGIFFGKRLTIHTYSLAGLCAGLSG
jgi:nicotinamidase-related amidase